MEKRAVAPLVLAGAGLTLAIAVVVLMVKVRAGASEPSVSPAELSRAGSRPPPATRGGAGEAAETPPAVTPRLQPPPDEPEPSPPVAERGTGDSPLAPAGIGDSAAAVPAPVTLAEKMVEANRLYDRGDYEAATRMADEALKEEPQNVKMLRIGASSACILGDPAAARVHYDKLPERDQQQIARRCKRYGVEF